MAKFGIQLKLNGEKRYGAVYLQYRRRKIDKEELFRSSFEVLTLMNGNFYVCVASLWSSAFGRVDLESLWTNFAHLNLIISE